MATPSHIRRGPPHSSSANIACTPCRRVKMKCVVDPGAPRGQCVRCLRKGLICLFESHRRGRQPGSKSSRAVNDDSALRAAAMGKTSPPPPARLIEWPTPQQYGNGSPTSQASKTIESREHSLSEEKSFSHKGSAATESLAPSGLLSAEAMTGDFSLENVFTIPGSAKRLSTTTSVSSSTFHTQQVRGAVRDPLTLGVVSMPIARSLFDSFFTYLNPFIAQLDPVLYTFDSVRCRSPFLLTCILSAAARIFNAPLHGRLHDHAEKLLAQTLVAYEKSPEIVQSILLLTYWKEPEDCRSWLLVGFAIRMCIAMKWHKLGSKDEPGGTPRTETEIREQRNKERTWLVLFVYDRSISFQLGHPWMIHIDDFLKDVRDWHLKPFAVQNNDDLLIALYQLRKITAQKMSLWPDAFASANEQLEASLTSFTDSLDTWEYDWCDGRFKGSPTEFMVRFYGAHCRLLLTSSRLQLAQVQKGSPPDEHVHTCIKIGCQIFKLLVEELAPSQSLYYIQDSVHIMTVYTTILLVKILLTFRQQLSSRVETAVTKVILDASDVFATQCISPTSSCSYQSRFLKNVVSEYWRSVEKSDNMKSTSIQEPQQLDIQVDILVSRAIEVSGVAVHDPDSVLGGRGIAPDIDSLNMVAGDFYGNSFMASTSFTDTHTWGDLFANAGFSIDQGAFLPFDMDGGAVEDMRQL